MRPGAAGRPDLTRRRVQSQRESELAHDDAKSPLEARLRAAPRRRFETLRESASDINRNKASLEIQDFAFITNGFFETNKNSNAGKSSIMRIVIIFCAVALSLASGVALAGDSSTPNTTGAITTDMKPNKALAAPTLDDAAARSAKAIECSQKAEVQNLHGKSRKQFMRECKRGV